jgi:hypothetical protein
MGRRSSRPNADRDGLTVYDLPTAFYLSVLLRIFSISLEPSFSYADAGEWQALANGRHIGFGGIHWDFSALFPQRYHTSAAGWKNKISPSSPGIHHVVRVRSHGFLAGGPFNPRRSTDKIHRVTDTDVTYALTNHLAVRLNVSLCLAAFHVPWERRRAERLTTLSGHFFSHADAANG